MTINIGEYSQSSSFVMKNSLSVLENVLIYIRISNFITNVFTSLKKHFYGKSCSNTDGKRHDGFLGHDSLSEEF